MADPTCELRRGGWVVRCVIFLVALLAFALSGNAVGSCRFLVTEPEGRAIGLYSYEDPDNVDGACQSIAFLKDASDEDIFADDDSWKAAQGLGSAGAALGGLTVLLMFLGFFCKMCANKMCFRFLFPLMLLSSGVCTVLTNIVYNADFCDDMEDENGTVIEKRGCTASSGTASAGAAFVLYLIASISMFWCMTPWEEPMYKFVDELTVLAPADDAGKARPEAVSEPEMTEGLHIEEQNV